VAATSATTTTTTATARQRITRKVTGAQENGDCENKNDILAHAIAVIFA
jgi:hypothetical protein